MTEAEFLERVDAWALGGLSADEEAELERHLAAHPALRPAVRTAFTTAAALGRALPPSPPPPGAWGRLVAALPGREAAGAVAPGPRRGRGALGWGVAAIAAAVALWLWIDRDRGQRALREARTREVDAERALAATAGDDRARLETCARELEALRGRAALAGEAVALLELAGTQLIPLEAPAAATSPVAANAIYHRGVKKAYVVVKGLADDPAGYRIWVNRAGQRVPAGQLVATAGGGVIASVSADTLDDVPEAFELTRANGDVVLRSRIKI